MHATTVRNKRRLCLLKLSLVGTVVLLTASVPHGFGRLQLFFNFWTSVAGTSSKIVILLLFFIISNLLSCEKLPGRARKSKIAIFLQFFGHRPSFPAKGLPHTIRYNLEIAILFQFLDTDLPGEVERPYNSGNSKTL